MIPIPVKLIKRLTTLNNIKFNKIITNNSKIINLFITITMIYIYIIKWKLFLRIREKNRRMQPTVHLAARYSSVCPWNFVCPCGFCKSCTILQIERFPAVVFESHVSSQFNKSQDWYKSSFAYVSARGLMTHQHFRLVLLLCLLVQYNQLSWK